jgi:hypothetical protein
VESAHGVTEGTDVVGRSAGQLAPCMRHGWFAGMSLSYNECEVYEVKCMVQSFLGLFRNERTAMTTCQHTGVASE